VTPQERVDAWLADFESALAARDIERVAGKFALDSFWRDLVSFTWNIKTVEGREQIADMLSARLDDTDPSGFRTTETPDEADGVTSAWIEFETATGRAHGHLRLKGDEGWTLLTSLQELKGHEEGKALAARAAPSTVQIRIASRGPSRRRSRTANSVTPHSLTS